MEKTVCTLWTTLHTFTPPIFQHKFQPLLHTYYTDCNRYLGRFQKQTSPSKAMNFRFEADRKGELRKFPIANLAEGPKVKTLRTRN